MFELTSPSRARYNNNIVHFITRDNKVRKSSEKKRFVTEVEFKGRECGAHRGIHYMKRLGVCPLKLIVRHSINTERSIPANVRVHNVPLDDALMVVADDFLSPAFALALALGPALDELLEELLTTVS